MLKIETTRIAGSDLRAVPFPCPAWNALGASRHGGLSAVIA